MDENVQSFSSSIQIPSSLSKIKQEICARVPPPPPSAEFPSTAFLRKTNTSHTGMISKPSDSSNSKFMTLHSHSEPLTRQATMQQILASIPRAASKYSDKTKETPTTERLNTLRASNVTTTASILERIRSHIFDFISPPPTPTPASNANSEDEWDYDESCNTEELIKTKFPKETRFAMSNLSICKKHRVMLCEHCLQSLHKITSKDVKKTEKKALKIPCPKNILCDRGIHYGECASDIREKVIPSCICHQDSISILPERKKYVMKPKKAPPVKCPEPTPPIKTTKDVSCNTNYQSYKSRHADIAIRALENLRITIDEYIPIKITRELPEQSTEWEDGVDGNFSHDPDDQTEKQNIELGGYESGKIVVVSSMVTKTFIPFSAEEAHNEDLTNALNASDEPEPSASTSNMPDCNAKNK